MASYTVDQLVSKLRQLAAALLKRKDFNDFAMIVKKQRQSNIDSGLDINGKPFVPLASSTISRKRRKGAKNPEKILVEKGVLRNPAIAATDKSASLTVPASRETISEAHNKGNGHVPQREHWGITKEAEKQIRDLFEDKVNDVIRRILGSR